MRTRSKRLAKYLQDALVLLILGGLLYCGASWQMFSKGSDAAYYQCYAVAFWQGWSGLSKLPSDQCIFLTHADKNVMLVTQDELLHAENLPNRNKMGLLALGKYLKVGGMAVGCQ